MAPSTKISKSAVMTRAWKIYRSKWQYSKSFAQCLRRAWEIEKADAEYTLNNYYWAHPEERPETLGDIIRRKNRERGVPEPVFVSTPGGKWMFITPALQ
ncbi:hypothetical protein Barb6_02769 [Bacteroidales bacterium Barb6]|nr:hypothetical protein Barb6_02769 [Bacteroidales bacterium Barb6]